MNSEAQPIRAPQGAIAWTAVDGFAYDEHEVPRHVDAGELVLVVSSDGMLRGVQPHDHAPMIAVVRVEADVVEVIQRLEELAGGTASVRDVNELRARMTAAVHRVDVLEDRATGLDTGLAVEVAALKHRVRRLEDRGSR